MHNAESLFWGGVGGELGIHNATVVVECVRKGCGERIDKVRAGLERFMGPGLCLRLLEDWRGREGCLYHSARATRTVVVVVVRDRRRL